MLTVLLLNGGQVVSAGRLMEQVWRGSPPPGAPKTLRSYISRLRALLGPDVSLVARGGGYVISIDPEVLDSRRFERLAAAGRAALGAGEPAVAGVRFRQALALWHGPALAGVAEVEPLALEAARLEEIRVAVVEGRIEADLALGRHLEVTGELESLVAEYPLRERLWQLLVLALYRGERQADALAAYRRARSVLAEELGIEPSEELRRLEQAVLRQEVPEVPLTARHNLPAPLTSFLGRDPDLAKVERLLGEARLVTLTGAGGAGKTRLAVEAGARLVDRFQDGVWLADLAGVAKAELVPAHVMEALGVRQEGGLPVLEALRYRLRSADLLLVLDNCEHLLDACAELINTLLRTSPGLRVMATSREPLGLPGEVVYPVQPLEVPPDSADTEASARAAAVRLFLDRVSAARGGVAGDVPAEVAGRICRKLDGLPLAIELAAARMGTLSASEIEAHLADRFGFLAYRRPVADQRHQALQTAMDWSYDQLTPEEREVFADLSVFSGSFGLGQVADICRPDRTAVLEVIDRLASKSLMTAEPAEGGTRYRLLETVRQYAADRLTEADGTETARSRHALAFLNLAEQEHNLAALSRDQDNFRAVLEWSLSSGHQTGPRLARALGSFWLARGLLQEGRDWLERALVQGQLHEHVRADLLRLLGTVLFEAGDLGRAEAVLTEGSHVALAAGLAAAGARIGVLLAEIHDLQGEDDTEVLQECETAIAVLDSEGDLEGLAEAWLLAGNLAFFRGEWPAYQEAFERSIAYARQGRNHRAEFEASGWLVTTFHDLTVPVDQAIGRAEELLVAVRGEPWAEAHLLRPLSLLYVYAGRFADARMTCARSQSMFAELGAKLAVAQTATQAGLIELHAGDPATAEQYWREAYEAFQAMAERGWLSTVASSLAEVLYQQGRLDEAQQMTQEAQALAQPSDIDVQARWRAVKAKLLARSGQLSTARQLIGEAEALVSGTSAVALHAEVLTAKAEVDRLAGAPDHAAASLAAVLRIYEERRAVSLADRTRTALTSLTAHPSAEA